MNDLLETEIKIGKVCFIEFRFFSIDRSLSNQSDLVFVKNGPLPDFLKNPIAGSKTIFLEDMCDFFAICYFI